MRVPETWSQRSLSEVVELQRGFDLPAHSRRPGAFPVLTSGAGSDTHDEGPVAGPGFVVGRATNLGRPKWSDTAFWPHNTTMFAKDFKGNDPRWLYHLFEATDLSGYDSGSVQPMLNRNYIAAVQIVVPPLPEQRAIAEVLGALDDKIAANAKLANSAEAVAVAAASAASGRRPLAEVAVLSRAQAQPSALGDAAVRHFSLPAFDEGGMPSLDIASSIKSNKFVVDRPSVLVSKLNPRFPRIWHVDATTDAAISLASTEFLVLHPLSAPTTVLWALLADPAFSRSLEAKVAGTSGSHQRVKPGEVLAESIGDPESLTEDRIALIDAAVRAAGSAREENRALAALRDALLPELMSGRLRVKDAERALEGAV